MRSPWRWKWPSSTPISPADSWPSGSPDNKGFSVSESSVYRLFNSQGLIKSPEMKMAAGKDFHAKTTRPHQMWATDASYFRVCGWGFYYLVTVMDDFSRFIIAWRLQTDMTSDSFMRLSRTQSTSQA